MRLSIDHDDGHPIRDRIAPDDPPATGRGAASAGGLRAVGPAQGNVALDGGRGR